MTRRGGQFSASSSTAALRSPRAPPTTRSACGTREPERFCASSKGIRYRHQPRRARNRRKPRPRLGLRRQHDPPVGPANRKGFARPRRASRYRHQPRRARNRRKPRPRLWLRDNTIRLWDARTGKVLRVLGGHQNTVTSLAALEIDGSLGLASGSRDNTIRLWDARTGKVLRVLEGHESMSPASPRSKSTEASRLASGSEDNTIRLWDARTGKVLRVLEGIRLCHQPRRARNRRKPRLPRLLGQHGSPVGSANRKGFARPRRA